MKTKLAIATGSGVQVARHTENTWDIPFSALHDHHFTSIAAGEHTLLAGAKNGLYLSLDEGQTWQQPGAGLDNPHIRAVHFHNADPKTVLIGTEPAALYVSQDGGVTWDERPEIADLRDKYEWSLPYSPEAGCVRNFASHGERGYAAVEQGGLLRTDDGGRSWMLMDRNENEQLSEAPDPWIHPDVHSVEVHPSSHDLIFAPTGGGLFASESGGESWTRLHKRYCRAIWLDSEDNNLMVLGTADSPDRNGRIEVSQNGGSSWETSTRSLNPFWQRTMVEQFLQMEDLLLAVLSNGLILSADLSDIDNLEWHVIRELPENARALAEAPLPDFSVAV